MQMRDLLRRRKVEQLHRAVLYEEEREHDAENAQQVRCLACCLVSDVHDASFPKSLSAVFSKLTEADSAYPPRPGSLHDAGSRVS